MLRSLWSRIALRTSACVRSVQPQSGFLLGRRRVIGAGDAHQDLLDETGARAARARRLGVLAHVVEREEPLLLDRLHDRAFAHAVAAADFHVVGHGGRAALSQVSGVAEVGFAEHQPIAQVGDAAAVAQQLEVVGAVHGVAVEHRADELLVLHDELLVDARHRIGERDVLGAVAAHEIARGKEIDAGDLELGRRDRPHVAPDAEQREMIRADFRHVEKRRDETVRDAAVIHAFAHGIDARIERLHGVAHHDAAAAMQARFLGELGVRPHADGHHDEVRGNRFAVLEAHGTHAARFAGDDFGGLLRQQEFEPARFERALQELRRGLDRAGAP